MITTKKNSVSVLELRQLLYALKDGRPDIGIRFRLIGKLWQKNHLEIFEITEKGVVLRDERKDNVVTVHDLNNVMQFELEHAFQQYQPHFHYPVEPA